MIDAKKKAEKLIDAMIPGTASIEILKEVLDKAQQARLRAGYNGEYTDGGASVMEEKVVIYASGALNIIPEEWGGIWEDLSNKRDPEYSEYLRLKKKFNQ